MLVSALAALTGGCNGNAPFITPDRMANGLVIILPGIEGVSGLNRDIRRGLVAAGIYRGMPIKSWGCQIPLVGMMVKQINFLGNRIDGAAVAREIVKYQDEHPGAPVHVVGHSGGGGIAVFVAEAMPEGRKIKGLILLSASISSAHNLTKALSRCEDGIVNFHANGDPLLLVGTIFFGNVCGTHGPGAGACGFDEPSDSDSEAKKLAYANLYQIEITGNMIQGRGIGHVSTTDQQFVTEYVAPWIYSSDWPVMDTDTYASRSY